MEGQMLYFRDKDFFEAVIVHMFKELKRLWLKIEENYNKYTYKHT